MLGSLEADGELRVVCEWKYAREVCKEQRRQKGEEEETTGAIPGRVLWGFKLIL